MAPDSKMTWPSRSRTVTCSHARRDGYAVGSLCPVRLRTVTSMAS